jgi:hypothetical protein
MTIEQRAGVSSGLIIWPEKAGFPAVDPATPPFYGYVAPLSGEEGVNTDRPLVEVPLFKRNRRAFAHLLGMSGAGGSASINLDTRFFGHMASLFMGLDKYSRKGGRHIWGVGTPLSCQTEKQSTESPILYIRQPGQKVNTLDFGSSQVGPVVYSAQFMGKGSELYTGLEAAGGTVVDETFEPLSYLNGQVQKGTGVLGTIITEYSMSMTQNLQRTDARFSDKAAAIVAGNPAANGRLGIMYVDNGFYLEGVNSTSLYFEMIWSNRAADAEVRRPRWGQRGSGLADGRGGVGWNRGRAAVVAGFDVADDRRVERQDSPVGVRRRADHADAAACRRGSLGAGDGGRGARVHGHDGRHVHGTAADPHVVGGRGDVARYRPDGRSLGRRGDRHRRGGAPGLRRRHVYRSSERSDVGLRGGDVESQR